jgi:hypothetical protein
LLGEDPGMASSSKGRSSSRKRSRTGKARVISTRRKDALPRTGSISAGRRKPVVLPPIDALTEPLATAVAARKKKAHGLHQKKRTASRKEATRAAGRAFAELDKLDAMEIALALAALEPVADTVAVVEPPATAYEEFAVTTVEAPEVAALGLVESELDMEAFARVEELPPASVANAPALIAPALEPAMVTAPEPVAGAVDVVEPHATAYEELTVTALEAPEVEALAVVETELEVETSAIVEEHPVEAVIAPRIAIGLPPIPEETCASPPARTTAESPASPAPAPHHERRSLMPAISRLLSTLSRWTGVSGTK